LTTIVVCSMPPPPLSFPVLARSFASPSNIFCSLIVLSSVFPLLFLFPPLLQSPARSAFSVFAASLSFSSCPPVYPPWRRLVRHFCVLVPLHL
jgi:hypothetical protein